jgi:hypothetical protein
MKQAKSINAFQSAEEKSVFGKATVDNKKPEVFAPPPVRRSRKSGSMSWVNFLPVAKLLIY